MTTKKIFLSFLALVSLIPSLVAAATLNVTANPSVIVGQSFRADVVLDTQGDDVNAIQGEITFSPNLFTLEGINDGGSPISLWIEAPHEVSSGKVAFSGIMPGGFVGSTGSVVGILLVPRASGTGVVGIQNAKLLRNDGQGSVIVITTMNQTILIGASSATPSGTPAGPSTSFTVPGSFTPVIARDANVYGGKYFLVFSATDKGSGINHYEVLEVPAGAAIPQNAPWTIATSPYLLKDQVLSSDVYVRAVNNGGSVTVAKMPARFPPSAASRIVSLGFALLLILLLLALTIFFIVRSKRKRRLSEV
jgi:hypothetical protein